MKVQTLGDASSLTSCSLFGSLSANHWAGPQEAAICGHHGDRVCGWALKLMCYLEQKKYICVSRGDRRCGAWSISYGGQRDEPQRNRKRGELGSLNERGVGERRKKKPSSTCSMQNTRCAGWRPIRLLCSGFQYLPANLSSCCPVWKYLKERTLQSELFMNFLSLFSDFSSDHLGFKLEVLKYFLEMFIKMVKNDIYPSIHHFLLTVS